MTRYRYLDFATISGSGILRQTLAEKLINQTAKKEKHPQDWLQIKDEIIRLNKQHFQSSR